MKKNIKNLLAIALLFSVFFTVKAQDGAKLYKQNCAACHKIDKVSIGPPLKGAFDKWKEAGEEEMIFEWVANPTELHESGKSKMAKAIWDFSPMTMTPMAHLSKEEVAAIFKFADTPPVVEKKKEEVATTTNVTKAVPSPGFSTGTIVFLIGIIGFLIVALLVLMNGVKALKNKGNTEGKVKYDEEGFGFLTKSVAIEDEDSILLDHNYDGIQELDNVLPPWWVWMFYGTIIFTFIYWGMYQTFGVWPLQIEAYEMEVKTAEKEVYAYKEANGLLISAETVTVLTDESALAAGKEIFEGTCAACHKVDGSGLVGPNLTDKYWIYGGKIGNIFTSISEGRPNGMPAHKSQFNELKIQQIGSYVLSLPFAEGKEPEGDLMK